MDLLKFIKNRERLPMNIRSLKTRTKEYIKDSDEFYDLL